MYHKKRENVWSLFYCIVLDTAENTDVLKKDEENCLILIKESLTEWGCIDIGSYVEERAVVIKMDAPPTLEIPAFINAFKTRLGRLYKSGKRGIFNQGYFAATMRSCSDRPEVDYFKMKEEKQ